MDVSLATYFKSKLLLIIIINLLIDLLLLEKYLLGAKYTNGRDKRLWVLFSLHTLQSIEM